MRERLAGYFRKKPSPTIHNIDVSEILEFDPNADPLQNEHGNIMTLGKEEKPVPKDVQDEFYRRIHKEQKREGTLGLIIRPEHLFYVTYREPFHEVTRMYCGWGEGIDPQFQRFMWTHLISFKQVNGGFVPWKVDYHYEHPSDTRQEEGSQKIYFPQSSFTTVFIGDDDFFRWDINSAKTAQVDYNRDYVRIFFNNELYYYPAQLGRDGMQVNDGKIILEQTKNNVPSRLQIPIASPRENVIEKLFDDPRLLDNPLNAPVEADTSWKRANILGAANATWV